MRRGACKRCRRGSGEIEQRGHVEAESPITVKLKVKQGYGGKQNRCNCEISFQCRVKPSVSHPYPGQNHQGGDNGQITGYGKVHRQPVPNHRKVVGQRGIMHETVIVQHENNFLQHEECHKKRHHHQEFQHCFFHGLKIQRLLCVQKLLCGFSERSLDGLNMLLWLYSSFTHTKLHKNLRIYPPVRYKIG